MQNLRIGPGDELEITIFEASDLSAHGRVDSEGNIFIPLVGSAHVAGMTSASRTGHCSETATEPCSQPPASFCVREGVHER